jgi:hypothetical protein
VERERCPSAQPTGVDPHDLGRGDPEITGDQCSHRDERDDETQRQPADLPPADCPRHAVPELPRDGEGKCAGKQAVHEEEPAIGRVAGVERQQAGRCEGDDEDGEGSVEGCRVHRPRTIVPRPRRSSDEPVGGRAAAPPTRSVESVLLMHEIDAIGPKAFIR